MHYQQSTLNGYLPDDAHEQLWATGVFTRVDGDALTIMGSVENVSKALDLFNSWQEE